MLRVRVSSTYRITIPREVREMLGIRKGQIVTVLPVGGVIEIVPDQDLSALEGAFPGISLTNVREEPPGGDRRSP